METFEATTPFQRYVLSAVLVHERRGETPVQSFDVRDFCVEHLSTLEATSFESGVSRESVIRALSTLEDEGLLESEVVDASPVGKGRPAYSLAVDPSALEDALADDEMFAPLLASLED
jgi:hypothetical protein